jgi:hypothetical protein
MAGILPELKAVAAALERAGCGELLVPEKGMAAVYDGRGEGYALHRDTNAIGAGRWGAQSALSPQISNVGYFQSTDIDCCWWTRWTSARGYTVILYCGSSQPWSQADSGVLHIRLADGSEVEVAPDSGIHKHTSIFVAHNHSDIPGCSVHQCTQESRIVESIPQPLQ